MTAFTSGKINRDPMPYVRTYNGTDECRISATLAGRQGSRFENGFGQVVQTHYDPRPEFDHHNPILAAFRAQQSDASLSRRASAWLASVPSMGHAMGATPEHIDHARKALTKLAALA